MFVDIIRAWKDPEYRQSLSKAERAMLPAHPAGLTELAEEEIRAVSGGAPDAGAGADAGTHSYPPGTHPVPDAEDPGDNKRIREQERRKKAKKQNIEGGAAADGDDTGDDTGGGDTGTL